MCEPDEANAQGREEEKACGSISVINAQSQSNPIGDHGAIPSASAIQTRSDTAGMNA